MKLGYIIISQSFISRPTMNYNKFLQNEIIAEGLYDLPWFEIPAHYRKTFILFNYHTQRTIKVYAVRVIPITLATFVSVIKVLYSVINLMRTL